MFAQPPDNSPITPEIAAHVLFHFGRDGGYPASGFPTALMGLIDKADVVNRALLKRAYRGYVTAMELAKNTEDGIATLAQIAEGTR
jgi:hypothetical protein